MKLSESAERVLKLRYYHEGEDWKALCKRVSKCIASAEKTEKLQKYWENRFFDAIYNLYIMPNSPTLKNAGTNNKALAACYVLQPYDNRESIFDTLKEAVIVQSRGGGTGFNFSTLRPKNEAIQSINGKASGPISFMKIYDLAIGETIRQGGLRAGAMMATFDYRHPDIMDFITCKQTEKDLTHFNLSVLLTQDFFTALEKNEDIKLWFPDYTKYKNYNEEWNGDFDDWLNKKKPIKVYKKIKVKDLWNAIINNSWENGEPGVIFKDIVNEKTPHPKDTSLISTNPCGEQALIPYGVCNLVSINLSKLLTGDLEFDFDSFSELLETSLRFGDNSIDIADYGLEKVNEAARTYRNVGVGIMGWADLLIKMKIKYDSKEAIASIDTIGSFMKDQLNIYSTTLGKEKGTAKDCDRRNIAVSSIQPTGTVSMICECSSGIEPNFDFAIKRKDETGEHIVYNSIATSYLKENKTDVLPDYFMKANDITYDWHLNHLECWQKYIDNGISKTLNMPNSATKSDIEQSLLYAAKTKNIKSFTVYRDGSRQLQVLNKIEKKPDRFQQPDRLLENRPDRFYGYTEKIPVANGNLYLTINKELSEEDYTLVREILQNRGKIVEIFASLGKAGSDISGYMQAVTRQISIAIRKFGASVEDAIETLRGISFAPSFYKGKLANSPIDALVRAIDREIDLRERALKEENKEQKEVPTVKEEKVSKETCPICGEYYKYIEGCKACACGSKCG